MGTKPTRLERRDVIAPLWRKKVDATVVTSGVTPVPAWVAKMWGMDQLELSSPDSHSGNIYFETQFQKKRYRSIFSRKKPRGQLFLNFESTLRNSLAHTFSMTWARTIEGELRKNQCDEFRAEEEIPFWEFLDIECDIETRRIILTAHYRQEPTFPLLFRALLSPEHRGVLEASIDQSFRESAKSNLSGWISRNELAAHGAVSYAIYVLIDQKNQLVYVGQAGESLAKRLGRNTHESINDWDHFLYWEIPRDRRDSLDDFERMLIQNFAAIFKNNLRIGTKISSDYQLVNKKKGA